MRAVLVGAGLMGRWHAHAIRAVGTELVGVIDPDRTAAGRLGPALDDLEAALALAPDVVHVCSPAGAHEAHALQALRAGVHVVCEKPVAATPSGTQKLLDAAAKAGVGLTPVHQFPFQDWRPLVDELGTVSAIEARICSAGTAEQPAALAGDIACHGLALFAHILGPSSLDGSWSARSLPGGQLHALGGGSVPLSLSVSLVGRPPRNELTVIGDRATLHADLFHGFGTVDRGEGTTGKILRPLRSAVLGGGAATLNLARRALRREPAFPGLRALVRAAHAAVAGGPPPLPPAHTLAVSRARDAILRGGR